MQAGNVGRKSSVLDGATVDTSSSPRARSHGVVTPFVLERRAPGSSCEAIAPTMVAMRADVELRDVAVSSRMCRRGRGLPAIEEALEQAIAALCAEAVGIMESLNQATLEYVRTRVQLDGRSASFRCCSIESPTCSS